ERTRRRSLDRRDRERSDERFRRAGVGSHFRGGRLEGGGLPAYLPGTVGRSVQDHARRRRHCPCGGDHDRRCGGETRDVRRSELLALAEADTASNQSASPGGAAKRLDKLAQLYDGLRIMRFEIRGARIDVPRQVDMKLAATRLHGLENGRIGEFVVE